ncbi:MAG TPA: hypothetical protein VLC50_07180 [Actinomycetes bacterium]|nr:hypothetical protein [Actinomycetes bacterium]
MSATPDVPTTSAEDLLRRHEPVVRYTSGELFLPSSVEAYLRSAALFRVADDTTEQLAAPTTLDTTALASIGRAHHGERLWLRFVEAPLGRRAYREWRRRPERVRFVGESGAAAVGLLARLVAALMRLSLLVRGRVPGGYAAAAEQAIAAAGGDQRAHYYGHVTRDGGYLVLQYWFFYAMNDWRSTFGGVNDHEADWEQVTVFAVEHDGTSTPAWVAFSSHDETGADLRRRCDDPDLEWVGLHPVVYAGAGSHSGSCLPGDYLITVSPPLPGWLEATRRRLMRVIPWSSPDPDGIGIPFIDYHRGDGRAVGPGHEQQWTVEVIDDTTPWVRDYTGLWGLDTHDPLGGERAPAGPRYERDGRVRASWSQPVAWAALDSEAPTSAEAAAALGRRATDLRQRVAELDVELAHARDELRGARALDQTQQRSPRAPGADVRAMAARVAALREEQHRLCRSLEATVVATERADEAAGRAGRSRVSTTDPVHAHLRHRPLPISKTPVNRSWLARVWTSASASVLFAALGLVLLSSSSDVLGVSLVVVAVMLVIEAVVHRRLLALIISLVTLALVVIAAIAAVALVVGNARVGFGILLLLAAGFMAVQTVVDALRRR